MAEPALSGSLWRNRDFTLVLGGGVVNNVGDWMLEVALPVYVYLETGSGKATAAVYVIELIAGLAFGAIGGNHDQPPHRHPPGRCLTPFGGTFRFSGG